MKWRDIFSIFLGLGAILLNMMLLVAMILVSAIGMIVMNKKKRLKIKKRCKVERLAKFITCLAVILTLTIGHFFLINGYLVGIISTVLWFIIPDITAYVLESVFKLEHKTDVYR